MSVANKRRLGKVEGALTPKQTAILAISRAVEQFESIREYATACRESGNQPRTRLYEQVGESVEAAWKAKGASREQLYDAVRKAQMDADFLYTLAITCNKAVLEDGQTNSLQVALLAEQAKTILEQDSASAEADRIIDYLARVPYPLDAPTAAAVDAAIRHQVETWAVLEKPRGAAQVNCIEAWIRQHYQKQGHKRIPPKAYWFRDLGLYEDQSDGWQHLRPNRDQLLELFGEPDACADFVASEDYSHGLAGVKDADFEKIYNSVLSALKNLTESGAVQKARAVCLGNIPMDFLDYALLIDGKWIDHYVIELAEWGAMLDVKGFRYIPPADPHPLAWGGIGKPGVEDGEPEVAAADDVNADRKAAQENLAKFKGRTKSINGRTYLNFADYIAWDGRKANAEEPADGFVVESFNAWIEANGRKDSAKLAGVAVEEIGLKLDRFDFIAIDDPAIATEKHQQRNDAIRRMSRLVSRKPMKVADWRARAMALAGELYRLNDAIALIQEQYFDGRAILLKSVVEQLQAEINLIEEIINKHNQTIALRLTIDRSMEVLSGAGHRQDNENPPMQFCDGYRIDLDTVHSIIQPRIFDSVARLVDWAKSETLDTFGEVQKSVDLMWPYAVGERSS